MAPNDGTHYYGEERPKYFDTTNGVKNTSLLHAVKVKALTPGTTYRYRIYSQEVLSHEGINVIYGRVAASDVYKKNALTFTTCDPNKKETSFVMINDIHGRENIITKLLNNANYKDKDLIIFNGDMVSEFKDEQTIFNGFMKEASICSLRRNLCITLAEIMKPVVSSPLRSRIFLSERTVPILSFQTRTCMFHNVGYGGSTNRIPISSTAVLPVMTVIVRIRWNG